MLWYLFKNELSCQRMKTEINWICAGSAAHHLNRMHLLTVALLNMQHISPSSSLIQNSSKVHSVNSPYRAWLYHLHSLDEVIKCRLIFECSSTWKQLTKQNISYSCIMHIIQKHTHSLIILPSLSLSLSLPLSSNKETATMRARVLGHGAKLCYWLASWAALSLFLPHNPCNPSVLAANTTHTSGPQGH